MERFEKYQPDRLDMPKPQVQTYEQLQEDRDWWKQKYFELYKSAGDMISALAERTIFNGDQKRP
jgi:hypothetical protein